MSAVFSSLAFQTSQTWSDLYTRAGVTASEVVELVSNRGPAEVSTSKMCISLLRNFSSAVAPDYLGSGRKRVSERGGGGAGAPQMEAVQIAGPSGVFEEWKVRGEVADLVLLSVFFVARCLSACLFLMGVRLACVVRML